MPSDAVKAAVKTLSSDLKGVGPATASAVLCALCGGCPFDADEVQCVVQQFRSWRSSVCGRQRLFHLNQSSLFRHRYMDSIKCTERACVVRTWLAGWLQVWLIGLLFVCSGGGGNEVRPRGTSVQCAFLRRLLAGLLLGPRPPAGE